MRIITNALLSLAIPALALGTTEASAKTRPSNFDMTRYSYQSRRSSSTFDSPRMRQIERADALIEKREAPRRENAVSPDVAAVLGPAQLIGDIDTPWGELWYYTGNFKYTYLKVSADYNRPITEEFEFRIYNSKLEFVGTVRDQLHYKVYENRPIDPETRKDDIELYGPYHREVTTAMCQVAPIITGNFFNDDDKLEVMVGMAVQTTYYSNNNYNRVYQLGGETYEATDYEGKTQTYNKMVYEIASQLGDVSTGLDASGREKTLMTFMNDYEPAEDLEIPDIEDGDEGEGGGYGDDTGLVIPGFWENYCAFGLNATVYRAARAGETGIRPVKSFDFPLSKLPGDMQSTPFVMSLEKNGQLYYVVSRYEDTFYNPYHSPIADMSMRQDNSLIVEIYKESADGDGLTLWQTTKIPTYLAPDSGSDKVLASYFSVGDFRYRDDLVFDKDGKASFYVTRADYLAGSDDSYIRSYYYYNADGTLGKTLFENCQSTVSMSDLEGFEPQEMFITVDPAGDYIFHFVDLESVKEVFSVNYRFEIDPDSDPERMTTNLDRVKRGDSYMYADELRVPMQDDQGNDIGRVLWFDNKGKFVRIDELNMGKNVYYALSYIEAGTLDPDFFHVGPEQEYMMLVKRGAGQESTEELLVVQAVSKENPHGKVLLQAVPDSRGSIAKVIADVESDQARLYVSRYDQPKSLYTWDVYNLPLSTSAIGEIAGPAPAAGVISFDGAEVRCAGADIELFSVNGTKVGAAYETLSTGGLAPGIYVARAAGETAKIHIR